MSPTLNPELKHIGLMAEDMAQPSGPDQAANLTLSYTDQGQGLPYLLLHGGAGPQSMRGLAAALQPHGRVLMPVHPGFDGTARPSSCDRVQHLAEAYLTLLDALDLRDVVIVGNSVGGWIAAEMALSQSPRIAAIVLLNACGIAPAPDARPIADPMAMAPAERAAAAFHDPARYALAPATPEAAAAMAANQQTLRIYAGEPFMHDPSLRGRLSALRKPARVLWGESDRIVDMDYGRHFTAAMPGAEFVPVPQAGHFPQIEQPHLVLQNILALRASSS